MAALRSPQLPLAAPQPDADPLDDMDVDAGAETETEEDGDATEEDEEPLREPDEGTAEGTSLKEAHLLSMLQRRRGDAQANGHAGLPPPAPAHPARPPPVPVPPRQRRLSQPPVFSPYPAPNASPAANGHFASVPNGVSFFPPPRAPHATANASPAMLPVSTAYGSVTSIASVESIRELEMSIFGTEIDGSAATRVQSERSRAAPAPFSLGTWEGEGLEDGGSDAETEEEDFSDEESEEEEEDAGPGGGPVRAKRSPMMVATGSDPTRRYICPQPGCGKVYKNPGGLKYHLAHGHAVYKPYKCCVEDCGKRYRNSGGLKYHLEHAHPAVFLSMRKVNAAGKPKIDLSACYDSGTKPQPQPPKPEKSPRARGTPWGSPPALSTLSVGSAPRRGGAVPVALPRQGYFPGGVARSVH
ncbi:hypothetical protein DFJ74DRAFT_656141 [Hyaloraphidium curvatum]|nr:hypothetical protein DFJ74DRAFT_656141 [Hyaloraphidium curvatum]